MNSKENIIEEATGKTNNKTKAFAIRYCTPKVRVENLILGVFYMVKYSEEFKLKIIKEYLKGSLGYKLLAKKYQIPHESSIKSWVRNYKEYGLTGISTRPSPVVYTVQFKLTVLQFMQRTCSSYPDAAIKFGMKSHSPIIQWKKDFEKGGIEGLNPKRKGRPSMSKKYQSKQKSQDKESSQVERLEHENELLRLEVAYLKKLKAFQENPNVFLEKHKQQWHSNSKKKDSN